MDIIKSVMIMSMLSSGIYSQTSCPAFVQTYQSPALPVFYSNQSLTLCCWFIPPPCTIDKVYFYWFKGRERLKNDGGQRVEMWQHNGFSFLHIRQLYPKDSDIYTCSITIMLTSHLMVVGKGNSTHIKVIDGIQAKNMTQLHPNHNSLSRSWLHHIYVSLSVVTASIIILCFGMWFIIRNREKKRKKSKGAAENKRDQELESESIEYAMLQFGDTNNDVPVLKHVTTSQDFAL
ncbi:uncharacterized protein LOC122814827 isoform X2 [Protopterus annectens]|nr:uncharacterized protein LOC122814827 isoform X2 [Protopterus annectens]XP_043943058.1 uncharacterized protein LOC122814827 isoform X2 [Protopterus annectens]